VIWLNLNVSVLDSPEVVGAEPVERATWLFLLRFCVGQENGGRIKGCRNWKDRQWQQLVRITQAETQAKTKLWVWEDDDLLVSFYPSEKENQVQRLRNIGSVTSEAKTEAARLNGKKGGRPKTQHKTQQDETQTITHGKPTENPRKTHGNPRKPTG